MNKMISTILVIVATIGFTNVRGGIEINGDVTAKDKSKIKLKKVENKSS
jgi:hypothetical protein